MKEVIEMSKIHLPGFTAEASLYNIRRRYHCMTISRPNTERREVISQLKGSVFHRFHGAGFLERSRTTRFANKVVNQPTPHVYRVAKAPGRCTALLATKTTAHAWMDAPATLREPRTRTLAPPDNDRCEIRFEAMGIAVEVKQTPDHPAQLET
jgi:hypothetical protein